MQSLRRRRRLGMRRSGHLRQSSRGWKAGGAYRTKAQEERAARATMLREPVGLNPSQDDHKEQAACGKSFLEGPSLRETKAHSQRPPSWP